MMSVATGLEVSLAELLEGFQACGGRSLSRLTDKQLHRCPTHTGQTDGRDREPVRGRAIAALLGMK
jgi:hypothetical protein